MEEVTRLTAADYEQAIDFLDLVFSQAGRPHHFERMLPRMCVPDDERMNRHLAVKVNGRIAAMLGVYPLPTVIAGREFLFSTTGNVATHHRYEGRGYAHLLLNEAMRELERMGADASRLGGFRQRYNRFGFELGGTVYTLRMSSANVRRVNASPVRFERIGEGDVSAIEAIQTMQQTAPFFVRRGSVLDFYRTAVAWENVPYAAYDERNNLMGCLVASPDGKVCAELIARDDDAVHDVAVQWLQSGRSDGLTLPLPPWRVYAIRRLSRYCQSMAVEPASQFKIMRWAGICDALCRVQSTLLPLPEGSFTLGIDGAAALRFTCEGGQARCTESGDAPLLTLNPLEATRFLFGPQPPHTVAPFTDPLAASLFPLPLTWCGQDRV